MRLDINISNLDIPGPQCTPPPLLLPELAFQSAEYKMQPANSIVLSGMVLSSQVSKNYGSTIHVVQYNPPAVGQKETWKRWLIPDRLLA